MKFVPFPKRKLLISIYQTRLRDYIVFSGEFLLRSHRRLAGIMPVVRRLESKFRKPAHGRVTSTVSLLDGIDSVKNELSTIGRAIVSVVVELHDESGAHTLSASVECFITRVAEK
jgi:hypothetical protein